VRDEEVLLDGIKIVIRLFEKKKLRRWGERLEKKKEEGCEGKIFG
jgi:hypothetical protein